MPPPFHNHRFSEQPGHSSRCFACALTVRRSVPPAPQSGISSRPPPDRARLLPPAWIQIQAENPAHPPFRDPHGSISPQPALQDHNSRGTFHPSRPPPLYAPRCTAAPAPLPDSAQCCCTAAWDQSSWQAAPIFLLRPSQRDSVFPQI